MRRKIPFLVLATTLSLLASTTFAGTKKTPTTTVRLHCEGVASDGTSFVTELELTDGRKIQIR